MSRRSKQHASIHDEIAALMDKELLSWLKKGKPMLCPLTGVPLKDEAGKPVYKPLIAAEMKVIIDRLRQIGVQSPAMPGTASGNLVEEAKRRGVVYQGKKHPIPDVDIDAEDFATRSSG